MHFGFLATQTYLPWRISQWCAIDRFSRGILLVRSSSTLSTSSPSERPILLETLNTCVSTAIKGFPYITEAMTFALFLPTPGSFCNSSGLSGTIESYLFTSSLARPARCLLLLFGKVTDEIKGNISSGVAQTLIMDLGISQEEQV